MTWILVKWTWLNFYIYFIIVLRWGKNIVYEEEQSKVKDWLKKKGGGDECWNHEWLVENLL